ncbi:MAG: AraC family ligand binding domain-containing protein [Clostridia bacterium]|nr:AraC family ligand binding domain-containing protein [Clostridia bacterium]
MNLLHEVIVNKDYSDINPVQFGYENCTALHHFGPALRTHWLLHYVVSGKGIFRIEDREYTVTAGNIFVIPPFVETYYEADSNDPWQYIWIGFTKDDKIKIDFEDVMNIPYAHRIFEDMKKCSAMNTGRTEFLCSKIWQLISFVYDKKNETVNYVDKALNIIGSEYMTDISVQNIADRIGLERTYFSNLFKNKVAMSPKQYLLKTRMEQANIFLKDYGYNVSLTAASVGYSDIYTFSKAFKKYFGVSPSNILK